MVGEAILDRRRLVPTPENVISMHVVLFSTNTCQPILIKGRSFVDRCLSGVVLQRALTAIQLGFVAKTAKPIDLPFERFSISKFMRLLGVFFSVSSTFNFNSVTFNRDGFKLFK